MYAINLLKLNLCGPEKQNNPEKPFMYLGVYVSPNQYATLEGSLIRWLEEFRGEQLTIRNWIRYIT